MKIIYDGQEKNKCELKVFLIYNPKKTIICEAQAKKAEYSRIF